MNDSILYSMPNDMIHVIKPLSCSDMRVLLCNNLIIFDAAYLKLEVEKYLVMFQFIKFHSNRVYIIVFYSLKIRNANK